MNAVSLLFSRSGRLPPRPFAIAVIAVYAASFLSQALLGEPVLGRAGLWPFALLQAVLVWIWLALHTKRLRDAGQPSGLAVGIAGLYVLSLVLLLLVLAVITTTETGSSNFLLAGRGVIQIILVLYMFGVLAGSSDFGGLGVWLMGLVALLVLPVVLGIGYSIWAGTRPSIPAEP
ncbi:MAG TPA: hypothetical protein VFV87_22085 [Pirellulaceae bacterium]|nr:hypothetical protein [Pirellulaceae bacterium]